MMNQEQSKLNNHTLNQKQMNSNNHTLNPL